MTHVDWLAEVAAAARGGDVATRELRDRVLAADEPRAVLATLAAIAADAAAPVPTRVTALLTVARVAVIADLPIPDAALDAIDDVAVLEGAITRGAVAAVTGTLRRHPEAAPTTRRRIAHRLIAAGVRGPHITQLALDGGDEDTALDCAVDDFVGRVLPAPRTDLGAQAFATMALEWMERRPALWHALVVRLGAVGGGRAALAELVELVPHRDRAAVDRARLALRHPPGSMP